MLGTRVMATGLCRAQDKTRQKPEAKQTVIKQTSPASGKVMFLQYCALCHGAEGRGNGPAAIAMKSQPTVEQRISNLVSHIEMRQAK